MLQSVPMNGALLDVLDRAARPLRGVMPPRPVIDNLHRATQSLHRLKLPGMALDVNRIASAAQLDAAVLRRPLIDPTRGD